MKTYNQFIIDLNFSLYEGWTTPNLVRMVSKLGSLEKQIPNSRRDSPEYARYRRVADVAASTRNNPSTPFTRPAGDNFLNSVWNKFSSRLKPQTTVKTNSPTIQSTPQRSTLPSNNTRFRSGSGVGILKDRMGDYSSALKSRGAGAGGLINISPIELYDPNSDSTANSARRTAEKKFQNRQIPGA